jgi:heterodisulfide reductase subunit B
MKVSFFPGCSLEGTAREYGESIEAVCSALAIELKTLEDWSCCGASSAHCTNEFLSIALPARNLSLAEKADYDLVTPCAACFSRLKTAEKALTGESPVDVGIPFRGKINILHILEFLSRDAFAGGIEKNVTKSLQNLKAVSYYGCLLVRPPRTTNADCWEDPQNLDRLIARLGGESVCWPYKTECCGGSLVLSKVDIVRRLCGRLLDMAQEAGAECIVTACPLCQANLDARQAEIGHEKGVTYNMPVFYFTELMGLSFGNREAGTWFARHLVDPRPLLRAKGLL